MKGDRVVVSCSWIMILVFRVTVNGIRIIHDAIRIAIRTRVIIPVVVGESIRVTTIKNLGRSTWIVVHEIIRFHGTG